jgi:(+)-trans-carveol dehydrogenase
LTDLSGRVAVVTGAARGQGRSHALALAKAGADIAICDSCRQLETVPYGMATEDDLAETVSMIEALDRRVVSAKADVTNASDMDAFVAETISTLGRIDCVSANAGIWVAAGPLWEVSEEIFDETIDVDLKGVFLTCKYTIPHMLERGGSIVLTSSIAGDRGYPNAGHYVAAKHGVIGLMKTLANEAAPYNIRVNAITPGTVETDMIFNEHQYKLLAPDNPSPEAMIKVMERMTPLPVPGGATTPEDQSAAVLWLCSDASRYVTGVAISVDGGQNVSPF